MAGMTFLGWLAAAYMGSLALPAAQLTKFNHDFAKSVDAGDSCWDRISGTPGTYGQPSDYSLDLVCNYRLKEVEGTTWSITRD